MAPGLIAFILRKNGLKINRFTSYTLENILQNIDMSTCNIPWIILNVLYVVHYGYFVVSNVLRECTHVNKLWLQELLCETYEYLWFGLGSEVQGKESKPVLSELSSKYGSLILACDISCVFPEHSHFLFVIVCISTTIYYWLD